MQRGDPGRPPRCKGSGSPARIQPSLSSQVIVIRDKSVSSLKIVFEDAFHRSSFYYSKQENLGVVVGGVRGGGER